MLPYTSAPARGAPAADPQRPRPSVGPPGHDRSPPAPVAVQPGSAGIPLGKGPPARACRPLAAAVMPPRQCRTTRAVGWPPPAYGRPGRASSRTWPVAGPSWVRYSQAEARWCPTISSGTTSPSGWKTSRPAAHAKRHDWPWPARRRPRHGRGRAGIGTQTTRGRSVTAVRSSSLRISSARARCTSGSGVPGEGGDGFGVEDRADHGGAAHDGALVVVQAVDARRQERGHRRRHGPPDLTREDRRSRWRRHRRGQRDPRPRASLPVARRTAGCRRPRRRCGAAPPPAGRACCRRLTVAASSSADSSRAVALSFPPPHVGRLS